MLEERAGHGGSAAVVRGREGSAGERQEWEGGGGAVGGRTVGAGGWQVGVGGLGAARAGHTPNTTCLPATVGLPTYNDWK